MNELRLRHQAYPKVGKPHTIQRSETRRGPLLWDNLSDILLCEGPALFKPISYKPILNGFSRTAFEQAVERLSSFRSDIDRDVSNLKNCQRLTNLIPKHKGTIKSLWPLTKIQGPCSNSLKALARSLLEKSSGKVVFQSELGRMSDELHIIELAKVTTPDEAIQLARNIESLHRQLVTYANTSHAWLNPLSD